jgi:hypothetical protein
MAAIEGEAAHRAIGGRLVARGTPTARDRRAAGAI